MHKHHIIPRHMGGSDDPSNLIELTVEEHAEAHRLLWEKHGHWQDMIAWKGLAGIIDKEELLKEISSANGKKWLGKKHTETTKEKMSLVHKGNTYAKGIPKSDEHKQKLSKAKLKTWKIITPEGTEVIVNNLPFFCKENNLRQSKMTNIKKSGYLHKGYYCEKVL